MICYSKPSADQYSEICLNLMELSQHAISHLKFLKLNHQCFHVLILRYGAVRGKCDVSIALVCLLSSPVSQSSRSYSLFTLLIILSFSCRSRSYYSNLVVIKSIPSLKEFNWFSSLIWLYFVFSHIWKTYFISSNFIIQLSRITTQSSGFKDSVKTSVFVVFAIESSNLGSLCLFESSPSLDLLLKPRFFPVSFYKFSNNFQQQQQFKLKRYVQN